MQESSCRAESKFQFLIPALPSECSWVTVVSWLEGASLEGASLAVGGCNMTDQKIHNHLARTNSKLRLQVQLNELQFLKVTLL